MPAILETDLERLSTASIRVSLDPVQNAFQSLQLLLEAEEVSGFGDWVYYTAQKMSPQEMHCNRLVLYGLHYAVRPIRNYTHFPAYLMDLEQTPPEVLRDRMLDKYLEVCEVNPWIEKQERPTREQIMASFTEYLRFLQQGFPPENVDAALEQEAYELASRPAAMKETIISHLRWMWDTYLAQEWRRALPGLQQCLAAIRDLDFSRMSRMEAARRITGRSLEGTKWQSVIAGMERLIFVPNPHLGPYMGKSSCGGREVLLFGVRLPEEPGVDEEGLGLSRGEIVARLGTMADDTRLRMLRLIAERSEMRSQELMATLELSQPAISRHLSQLTATGFLAERRCEGAKCYSLQTERVEETLQAISNYVTGK